MDKRDIVMEKDKENIQKYKVHSVKYNALMNIILRVSSVIFPLITFPYATRVLGASSYGLVNFVTSVVSYFALVASLGIPAYGIRKCAEVRDAPQKLAENVKELLVINTISLVITYIAFIVILRLVGRFWNNRVLFLISSSAIILQTFGVEWFYEAIEQYDYITLRNIAFKFVSLILLFAFVHSTADVIAYCGITVVGTVGSNILNIIRLPKYVDIKEKTKLNLKQHLKPVFTLFFYYAATTIYTNLDTVMLGFMTNNAVVGYYNSAVKVKTVLVSLITALGAVALPRISYYLGRNEIESFKKLIRSSFGYAFYISLPLAAYFSVEARPVLLFLAGKEYSPAISAMQIITPSIVFIGIGSVTAYQMLIPLKRDDYTMLGAVVGALVDLILNSIFIPKYGAAGAALGTLVAEISVVCVHCVALRDLLPLVIDKLEFLKILLSTGISTAVMVLVCNMLQINNYFAECACSVCVFGICYILSGIIMKIQTEKDILISVLQKLRMYRNKK
jgi:O-antigen/teichoic acid export membrane protein